MPLFRSIVAQDEMQYRWKCMEWLINWLTNVKPWVCREYVIFYRVLKAIQHHHQSFKSSSNVLIIQDLRFGRSYSFADARLTIIIYYNCNIFAFASYIIRVYLPAKCDDITATNSFSRIIFTWEIVSWQLSRCDPPDIAWWITLQDFKNSGKHYTLLPRL